jgi:hypothetical protein
MSELLNEATSSREDLVLKLIHSVESTASLTWQRRSEAFLAFHGINFDKFPRNAEFVAARRARNIIAHGLGSLSVKDRTDPKLRGKLLSVSVEVYEGKILVSGQSLDGLVSLLIDYVNWLDTES